MPGLLPFDPGDTSGLGSGILGGLGNRLASALAIMNPQAGQAYMQQRMLPMEYQALSQMPDQNGQPMGPNRAMIALMHPEILSEMAKPQVLPFGSSLVSAFNPLGSAAPQQQAPMAQPTAGPLSPSLSQQVSRSPLPQQSGPQGNNVFAQGQNPMPDAGTINTLAEQSILGDPKAVPSIGMGSSPMAIQLRNAVLARRTQLMAERQISPAELSRRNAQWPAFEAAQTQMADVQSRMGMAGIEFQQIWPQFMQAMQKFNPSQFPTFNAFRQFIQEHAGDPTVAPIEQYMTTLRNIYSRATSTNPRGPTVNDKNHFDEAISKNWNMGQLQSVGGAIQQEIDAAAASPEKMRNRLSVEFGMGQNPPPDIIAQAKSALSRGVSRQDIIKRLSENGFSAKGF